MQQIRAVSFSQDKNIHTDDQKLQNSYAKRIKITSGFTLGKQGSPGKPQKQQITFDQLTRANNSMQNLIINDQYFQSNNSQVNGRSAQQCNPYLVVDSRIVPTNTQRIQKFVIFKPFIQFFQQIQKGQGLPGQALQVNQGQQQTNSNNQLILQMRSQITEYIEQLDKLKSEQEVRTQIFKFQQQSKKIRILIQENDKLSNELEQSKKKQEHSGNQSEQAKIKSLVQDLEGKVHRLILENEKLNNALFEKEHIIEEMQDSRDEDTQETDSNQESVFKQNKQLIQRNQSLQRQLETQNSLISSYKQENNRLQQMLQSKFQLESENLDLKVELRQIKEEKSQFPFKLVTQQRSPLK